MPKISVIIPVYNREDYLRQALDSVVNQTLKDIEIICVDDCSTDSSLNILKEYAQKDDRIIVLEQEQNQGQGVARNRALDIAKGEYIMFLDPDDWYELNACELCYNQISKNKNDFVIFPHIRYFNETKKNKTEVNRILPFANQGNIPNINPYELDTNFFVNCYTVCQIYSKEFLNKNNIRYSCRRMNEDIIFFVKALLETNNISVIDEPLYYYRIDENSTSFKSQNYKDIINARKEAYELVKKSRNCEKFMPYFLYYAIRTSANYFRLYSMNDKSIGEKFYNEVKNFFKLLNDEQNIQKDMFDKKRYYKYFKRIIKWDYIFWDIYYSIKRKFKDITLKALKGVQNG